MGASHRLSWVAGLEAPGGPGHGVPSGGRMLGVRAEEPLEAGEPPPGENWAKDWPGREEQREEAG